MKPELIAVKIRWVKSDPSDRVNILNKVSSLAGLRYLAAPLQQLAASFRSLSVTGGCCHDLH